LFQLVVAPTTENPSPRRPYHKFSERGLEPDLNAGEFDVGQAAAGGQGSRYLLIVTGR
jgi:hypothetical protein